MSRTIRPAKTTKGSTLLILSTMIALVTPLAYFQGFINKEETIIVNAKVLPTPIPSPSVTPGQGEEVPEVKAVGQNEEMKELIKQVFGEHADKAFKLLSCENASLNPKAINTAGNTPAGSRDIGLFQINEFHQDVNIKFLLDPELNARLAYKIYKDSGYTFKMWTCGKKYGI